MADAVTVNENDELPDAHADAETVRDAVTVAHADTDTDVSAVADAQCDDVRVAFGVLVKRGDVDADPDTERVLADVGDELVDPLTDPEMRAVRELDAEIVEERVPTGTDRVTDAVVDDDGLTDAEPHADGVTDDVRVGLTAVRDGEVVDIGDRDCDGLLDDERVATTVRDGVGTPVVVFEVEYEPVVVAVLRTVTDVDVLPDTVGERAGDADEERHRDGDADDVSVTLSVTDVEPLAVALVEGEVDALEDGDCDAETHAVALKELSAEGDADTDAVVVIDALEQCVGDGVGEPELLLDSEGEIVVESVDEAHAVVLPVVEGVALGDAEAETLTVEELRDEGDTVDDGEIDGECDDDDDVEADGQPVVDKDAVRLGDTVGDVEGDTEFVAVAEME